MTSANLKIDEKVDEFIDMFTKFHIKGENKSTFSFKILVGISGARDALLISSLFIHFLHHLVLQS